MSLATGDRLGPYEILGPIGRGGMGEVFRARDTRLGREVAIKVLPQGMAGDPAAAARFDQEARAVAALSHPHILAIHDFGQHEGVSYAVAELLEGETLRDRLSTGRMPLRKAVDVALQIAQGLSAAHAKSIVHRDLKPDNIFLTSDGHAKILDFGLAKVQAVQESDQTRTAAPTDPGTVLGTTGYLSPEQAQGKTVDTRSDIFSFGAVLYEMLTAKRAFKGDSTIDTLHSIVHDAPPAISAVLPDAPQELRWVLDKCLAKDPDDRYQSTRDLVVDLKNIARSLDSSPKLPITPASKAAAGGRNMWPLAIAVVAIAAAVIALVMFRGRTTSGAPPRAAVSNLSIEKITTLGTVIDASVSPDGKYVAYVTSENTRQGLWLRQVATASTIALVPATSAQGFWGVTFSPDGSAVYFAMFTPDEPLRAIYRIPILGGTPRKLVAGVDSFPTFSPDGRRMAWIRADYPESGSSVLMVADSDGQHAKVLATRKPPEFFAPVFFTAPAWSPDGAFIVCPMERRDQGIIGTLQAINANDGSLMPFPHYEWPGIGQPAWLPDGNSMVVVANTPSRRTQLWRISTKTVDRQLLTNDQSDYRKVSITSDAQSMVAVAAEAGSSLWIAPIDGASEPRRISSGRYDGISGVAAAPGGRVLFRTVDNGSNIWITNQDGSGRTQLTTEGFVAWPVASADGRSVVYAREGSGLWQVGLDGQGARPVPGTETGSYPETTKDGQWILFVSQVGGFEQLFRIPVAGGTAAPVFDNFSTRPSVSPDGKQVALYFRRSSTSAMTLGVMPIDGKAPTRQYDVAPSGAYLAVRWTADGKALLHNSAVGDRANIWLQPIEGGKPRMITRFSDQNIMAFDRSADGRSLLIARGTITRDAFLLKGF